MSIAARHTLSKAPLVDQRILICEDDSLIAMGWEALLSDEGYTVIDPAYNAVDALKMEYRHLPSVALIDIDLGGTIDGIPWLPNWLPWEQPSSSSLPITSVQGSRDGSLALTF